MAGGRRPARGEPSAGELHGGGEPTESRAEPWRACVEEISPDGVRDCPPRRVLVVDDHPVVRQGVVALLNAEPSLEVVGQAESAEEALDVVARLLPDVVLLDARLPGLSGVDAARTMLPEHPRLRAVLLTGFTNQGVLLDALDAGIHGLVLKESDATTIVAAVRAVASGQQFIDPLVEHRLLATREHRRRARQRYGLTPAELEVLEMVPQGLTNSEISSALGLSANTVKTHLAHAMRKLEVRNRAEAAVFVLSGGLS